MQSPHKRSFSAELKPPHRGINPNVIVAIAVVGIVAIGGYSHVKSEDKTDIRTLVEQKYSTLKDFRRPLLLPHPEPFILLQSTINPCFWRENNTLLLRASVCTSQELFEAPLII